MNESYQSLFQNYTDQRVVDKSRQYAKFTVASLLSVTEDQLSAEQAEVRRDYQSVGSMLLNNLSAKLTELLFPATRRFVKLDVSQETRTSAESDGSINDLNDALILLEEMLVKRSRAEGGYAALILAVKHLIATGQCCLRRDTSSKSYIVYALDNFVVRRDGRGLVLDAIIREKVAYQSLPKDLQAKLGQREATSSLYLYTRIQYMPDRDMYEVSQQVDSVVDYPLGVAEYPAKTCPWMFPTWNLKAGDHYARGLVEEYSGDFSRLSMLSESSALYLQEALRVLHLTNAQGQIKDDMTEAECGEFINTPQGTTVTAYEAGDYHKSAQALEEVNAITLRLSRAFMYSGTQRDSERTTAEEVRLVARETEKTLGGPYSNLASTLQIPLARVLLSEIDAGLVPDIVQNVLELEVIAGLDALGRSVDAQQLLTALSDALNAVAAVAQINQVTQNFLNPTAVIETIFSANGVNLTRYKTPEEVKQQMQQGQQQVQQGLEAQQALSTQLGGM